MFDTGRPQSYSIVGMLSQRMQCSRGFMRSFTVRITRVPVAQPHQESYSDDQPASLSSKQNEEVVAHRKH